MSSGDTREAAASDKRARRLKKSLEDFDRTAGLLRGELVDRYGEPDADALVRDARARYSEILPRVRWVEGRAAPVMNSRCVGALSQGDSAQDGTRPEMETLADEPADVLGARAPRDPASRDARGDRACGRLRDAFRRRRRRRLRSRRRDGVAFDHGVDYLRCGNLELAREVGADAFAPYLCLSDIALSEGLGWGLIRTQTLADGCSHFRFKQGGETRITSQTPEVQATLERIARAEAQQAAKAECRAEAR
jgi:hypothetical protein